MLRILAIWFVNQKEMKVRVFQVLREGGRGLISSLIQTSATERSELGSRAQSNMVFGIIVIGDMEVVNLC